MKILTLATLDWADTHVRRFLETTMEAGHYDVDWIAVSDAIRPEGDLCNWFDEYRMTLATQGECLYIDPDVDVRRNLDAIPGMSDKPLGWVRSPVPIPGVDEIIARAGYDTREVHANIGMLWLRECFRDRYQAAFDVSQQIAPSLDKMAGSRAFNLMLAMNPDVHFEIPYEYDVIWWDVPRHRGAYAVHYCNDMGKRIRPFVRWVEGAMTLLPVGQSSGGG